jgi:hypothetical protein
MPKKLKNTILLADVANLIDTLQLKVVDNCEHLQKWTQSIGYITPFYATLIEEARQDLVKNLSKWNEEELKMNFVSPIFKASQLNEPNKVQVFYERALTGQVKGYEFSLICDCMVATPTQGGRPQSPYFFLQEFKKEKGDKVDAEAQMLAAMLLAQEMNNDKKVVYGAWFRGESWHFTTLYGNDYCVAPTLVATKTDDLNQIVYRLQFLKTLILNK